MLEEILQSIHNFFVVKDGIHRGKFQISSNTIDVDFLQDGQYFRIVGSIFNDGVYVYPLADGLTDEEFVGEIWAMAVPPKVIALSNEIEDWMETNEQYLNSLYQSESFGGYSYTKPTNKNGGNIGWQDVFESKLNPWRKIS